MSSQKRHWAKHSGLPTDGLIPLNPCLQEPTNHPSNAPASRTFSSSCPWYGTVGLQQEKGHTVHLPDRVKCRVVKPMIKSPSNKIMFHWSDQRHTTKKHKARFPGRPVTVINEKGLRGAISHQLVMLPAHTMLPASPFCALTGLVERDPFASYHLPGDGERSDVP